jgi:hypothetical protein
MYPLSFSAHPGQLSGLTHDRKQGQEQKKKHNKHAVVCASRWEEEPVRLMQYKYRSMWTVHIVNPLKFVSPPKLVALNICQQPANKKLLHENE